MGTRGESRLIIFENPGDGTLNFTERAVGIYGASMAGLISNTRTSMVMAGWISSALRRGHGVD